MTRDKIYARPLDKLVDFNFDERVACVFPDMINRSVPGYTSIVAMTGILAAEFYRSGSVCYDLGCSLGASSLSMAKAINDPSVSIIAVDNSQAMLNKVDELLPPEIKQKIRFVCADINDINIRNASIVVMNFTLQFITPQKRTPLLSKIYQGMQTGGILILSEKLNYENEQEQQLLIEMHHFFKKANGYTDMEISQKRQALGNVLLPETLEQHKSRLHKAGFKQTEQWFQCFNFASLIAVK